MATDVKLQVPSQVPLHAPPQEPSRVARARRYVALDAARGFVMMYAQLRLLAAGWSSNRLRKW
jgi:hypothetical protein